MIENNPSAGSYAFSKAGEALAAKPSSTLQALQTAIRDLKKSQRSTADDSFVARVNDRVDAALALPIKNLAEVEAKMRLFLLSEREDLHEIQVVAIESMVAAMTAALRASAN